MSSICTEFVQNAWKKDLCSNCFKAKADHASAQTGNDPFVARQDGDTPPVGSTDLLTAPSTKSTNLEISNGGIPTGQGSASGSSFNKGHSETATINNNNNNVVVANNQLNSCGNLRFVKNKSNILSSNGHAAAFRKIGSSGVHLWEVGHLPGKPKMTESAEAHQINGVKNDVAEVDQKSNSATLNGNNKSAVAGILKEATKVLQNGSSKTKLHFGHSSERRGSVGFINESPQVIGYGGNDYEWDDQDSNPEDEPSDLDSLENFEMSEEDKAFCQLTDRNTEYNSDNANLSTVLGHGTEHISAAPDGKLKSPVSNGRHFQRVQSEVDLKLKNLHLEVENPSDNRHLTELDATRSDYLENDEPEDDDDDGTMVVKLPTSDTDDVIAHSVAATPTLTTATTSYRTGSETVPSRKYPSTPRTSVLKLFSEEPVTTAEVQAAIGSTQPLVVSTEERDAVSSSLSPTDEKSGPATVGRELESRHIPADNYAGVDCSPYDVVPLSSLQKGNACSNKIYGSLQAPTVPSCPPPSADDESQKLPLGAKMATKASPFGTNRFQSHPVLSKQMSAPEQSSSCSPKNYSSSSGRGEPKSTVGLCSTFCSPANNDSTESRFRNREYAAVNYSCHYAASYISTGFRSDDGSAKRASAALVSDLPPTPLTNPYSSTAILKGIPLQQQHHDSAVEHSPQKPPVTKPKPKLPLKPVGHQPKSFEDDISLTRSAESGGDKDLKSEEAPISSTTLSDMQNNHFQHHLPGNGHVIGAGTEPPGSSLYYPDVGKNNTFQMSSLATEDIRDPDTLAEQKSLSTFESKVATLSNSLDFSKRTPKRQAPRPPTGTQQESPVQFMKIDRTSTSSVVSEDGHHLTITGYKVASSLSMDRCTSSSKVFCNDVNMAHTFDRRSSPTSQLVALTSTDVGSSAHGGLTGGSSASTSMSSLNGSYYDGNHRGQAKDTPHKEGKLRKSKFSLKKLLKFGTKDDGDDSSKLKAGKILHFGSSHHQERKGKLEILHPIDLINASSPQQFDGLSLDKKSTETPVTSSVYGREGTPASVGLTARVCPKDEFQSESSELMEDNSDALSRNKPPPPPRSRCHGEEHAKDKPIRPPPPAKGKHQELHGSQDDLSDPVPVLRRKHDRSSPLSQEQRNSFYSSAMEYANLGDVRNTLTPKKPGRCPSNSMIDITYGQHLTNSGADAGYQEDQEERVTAANEKVEVTYYEPPGDVEVENVQPRIVPDELPGENVSPDSNASAALSAVQQGILHAEVVEPGVQHLEQHSKNCNDSSGKSDGKKIYERVVLKKGNLEKVYAKLPVAPLEPTESNVPSTMISDVDDVDSGGLSLWPRRKSSRLSLRKAKTVVHKNLEDNYGAVVTANHQTLIQILEQVSLTQPGMASKARLLEEVPPHWSDFKLLEDCQVTMVGGKAFFSAVWQQNVELTLMASQEPLCVISQSTRNPCVLTPFVEFEDAIPCGYFSQSGDSSNETYCNGTIWVLERMRVETLTSVAESLHLQGETDMESYEREVCFILLQVINCLKHLQVLGIEEMDADYGDFALIMKNNDVNYRLVLLPQVSSVSDGYRTLSATGSQQKLSLCQSAISAMMLLLNVDSVPGQCSMEIPSGIPSRESFRKIADTLNQERATSLSQAKLLLEYLLWGPSDLQGELQPNSNCVDQEQAYQRWLDLERATVLNNLIRTQSLWQIRLTVFEEYMLSFLVRTCAKTLREASSHLQMNKAKIC